MYNCSLFSGSVYLICVCPPRPLHSQLTVTGIRTRTLGVLRRGLSTLPHNKMMAERAEAARVT